MSNQSQSVVCRRCGRAFMLTANYCDFMARRGTRVNVPLVCTACFLRSGPLSKQQGQVKWFNDQKHYGFIATGEGEDVFFHQEQLLVDQTDEPQEGQPVLFHTRDTAKGPEALNVELV